MGDFCLSFWHPIHTLAKESEEIQEVVTFQGHLPTHHSALFTWLRSCGLGGLTVIRGTTAGITSSNSWGVMRGNSGPQRRDKGHQTQSLQSGTCQRGSVTLILTLSPRIRLDSRIWGSLVWIVFVFFINKLPLGKLLTFAEVCASPSTDEAKISDVSYPEKSTRKCSLSITPSFARVSWFSGML